jgi:hypothetical protein
LIQNYSRLGYKKFLYSWLRQQQNKNQAKKFATKRNSKISQSYWISNQWNIWTNFLKSITMKSPKGWWLVELLKIWKNESNELFNQCNEDNIKGRKRRIYSCSTKAKHHEKFQVKYDFTIKKEAIYFSWKKNILKLFSSMKVIEEKIFNFFTSPYFNEQRLNFLVSKNSFFSPIEF